MTANAPATLRASRFTAIALLATLIGGANAEETSGAKAPVSGSPGAGGRIVHGELSGEAQRAAA